MFRAALEELKDRYLGRFSLTHVLSREAQDVAMLSGRIDAEKLALFLRTVPPIAAIDHAFICGPAALLDTAERVLAGRGDAARARPCRALHRRRRAGAAAAGPGRNGGAAPRRRRGRGGARRYRPPLRHRRGRDRDRRGARRRARAALFLPRRHVLHLPGAAGRGRGGDGPQLLARTPGSSRPATSSPASLDRRRRIWCSITTKCNRKLTLRAPPA